MAITRAVDGGVAVLTMDDGRVNALDLDLFHELDARLDDCADDAAVVIAGRPGMFSAGLNTKVIGSLDAEGLLALFVQFGRTFLRVWLEPRPVVAAATGHAVAGGTILAMCADHAVAAAGDHRWGLTETTIGFVLPDWIIAVARGNVAADRLDDLLLPGATVGPEEAVAAGFADEVAAPGQVLDRALARARHLATLPRPAYAAQKRRLRGPAATSALTDLEADIRTSMAAGA